MTTTIVTRVSKGAPLTFADMDANLVNLQNTADTALSNVNIALDQLGNIHQEVVSNFEADALNLKNVSEQLAAFTTTTTTNTQKIKQLLGRVSDVYDVTETLTNTIYNNLPVYSICWFSLPVDGTAEVQVAHNVKFSNIISIKGRLVTDTKIIPLTLMADTININSFGIIPYGPGYIDLCIEYTKA
jgi:hypothetical protein